MRWVACGAGVVLLAGCAALPDTADATAEPDSSARALCDAGKYHESMRALPKEMAAWEEYTKATGNTREGAAGFLYSTTMFAIAIRGDADWGRILDDPDIPYDYKTEMISEIVEARLGKGASWSPYHTDVVIIPRSQSVDSWKEVNELLEHVLSEQDAPADADKPRR